MRRARRRPPVDRAAQRAAIARALGDRRARTQERLRELRARRKKASPAASPRRRGWLLVLAVILLLLLRECRCNEAPGPGTPTPAPVVIEVAAEPVPPEPPAERIRRRDRPEFDAGPPVPVPWIASFRMQVAARSPRLAACFVGAPRPGRFKWTTSVEPKHGLVSDHTFEPLLLADALTAAERACVIDVLSTPPYRLDVPEDRSTPSRVGLVIEF